MEVMQISAGGAFQGVERTNVKEEARLAGTEWERERVLGGGVRGNGQPLMYDLRGPCKDFVFRCEEWHSDCCVESS